MENEDGLTQQIWDGLIDTERDIRYYDKLANKSLRWHRWLSGLLVAASCGVATPLLSPLPEEVSAFFLAGVVAIGILSLLADYATKAAVSRSLCQRYQELKIEWKNLWYQGATQNEVNALSAKCLQTSRNITFIGDDALNQRTTEEAYLTLPREFGLEISKQ